MPAVQAAAAHAVCAAASMLSTHEASKGRGSPAGRRTVQHGTLRNTSSAQPTITQHSTACYPTCRAARSRSRAAPAPPSAPTRKVMREGGGGGRLPAVARHGRGTLMNCQGGRQWGARTAGGGGGRRLDAGAAGPRLVPPAASGRSSKGPRSREVQPGLPAASAPAGAGSAACAMVPLLHWRRSRALVEPWMGGKEVLEGVMWRQPQ